MNASSENNSEDREINSRNKINKMPQKCLFDMHACDLMKDLKMTSQSAAQEKLCSSSLFFNQLDDSTNLLNIKTLSISDRRHCTLCGCDFFDRDQQTEHYKLDWHRFNLKRKLCGLQSVIESEFNSLTQDKSDISSISGSESDFSSDSENDGQGVIWNKCLEATVDEEVSPKPRNLPPKQRVPLRLYFQNLSEGVFGIHRCLLCAKGDNSEPTTTIEAAIRKLFVNFKWAVILIGGGHFAAGVFDGNDLIEHKTFHRYTVRAKQGSSQGLKDGKHGGSHAKSAGATLRRYNELALVADIQTLLLSWSEQLNSCSLIFFRAPSFNKTVLFSHKNPPFKKGDSRLRNIPFATRRATLREVKRVHQSLSAIEIVPENIQDDFVDEVVMTDDKESNIASPQSKILNIEKVPHVGKKKKKKKKNENGKRQSDPDLVVMIGDVDDVNDDNEYKIFNHLYTLCKSGECKNLNDLISKVENYRGDDAIPASKLLNKQFGDTNLTLLHLSTKIGAVEIVKTLLYRGADPSIVDSKLQVPYAAAKSDAVKNVFKEFKMENPLRYDYIAAKIPDVETKTVSSKKKKKPKKKQEEQNAAEVPVKIPCTMCFKELANSVPFECYNLKFCSTDCVRKFRTGRMK